MARDISNRRAPREDDIAPPPLPPPRFLDQPNPLDGHPPYQSYQQEFNFSKGGFNSYDSLDNSPRHDRRNYSRTLERDEGYSSLMSNNVL